MVKVEASLDGFDYRAYERSAFAAVRNLQAPRRDWGECVAAAQRLLSEAEDLRGDATEQLFADRVHAAKLIAAARILDSASRPESELPTEHRRLLAIEASAAYAVTGNFPSAEAVLRTWLETDRDLLLRHLAMLTCVSPTRSLRVPLADADQNTNALREAVAAFLRTGSDVAFQALEGAWRSCAMAVSDDPHLASTMRAARVMLYQIHRLSTARNLLPFEGDLPEHYIENLLSTERWILLPSQYMALQSGALSSRDNTIFAFPTSTGKTLLGEICLAKELGHNPGLVAFVCPYQALARQVHRVVRTHFQRSIQVELLVGGYAPVQDLDPASRPTFVVATPERFDSMLRSDAEYLTHLRAVAFDEAHIIEQAGRGPRLEGLIGRLRLSQQRRGSPRILALSAAITADSLSRFQEWLAAPASLTLSFDWRPTARRLAIWEQPGRLAYYGIGDPLTSSVEGDSPIGHTTLPWPRPWIPTTTDYGRILSAEPNFFQNVVSLCQFLYQEHHQPILCVCATKSATRRLASLLSSVFPRLNPLPPPLVRLIELINLRYPHLATLRVALACGIAYHNASLPIEIRIGIEEASTDGHLVAVCSTTTLAEGVDLPFRFTILVDWLTWRDKDRVPMSGILFRNIAGRCGRAGYFTEGDTIIVDNPLGFPGHPTERLPEIHRNLLDPQSAVLESSLVLLNQQGISSSARESIEAQLEAQLIAAIPENPDEPNLSGAIARSLLVSVGGASDRLVQALENSETRLLSSNRPIATAASPLSLTDFGRAAVTTGLSASSCRGLDEWIQRPANFENVTAMLADLMFLSSRFPEADRMLEKLHRPRSKLVVKADNIPSVLSNWRSGERLEVIFAYLPTVRRSRRRPAVEEWLNGILQPVGWDDVYEEFLDFIAVGVQHYLAWVIRAAGRLAPAVFGTLSGVNWTRLASEVEQGVDSQWALWAIEQGCRAPRWVVAPFGRVLERTAQTEGVPEETVLRHSSFTELASLALSDRELSRPGTPDEFEELGRWIADHV